MAEIDVCVSACAQWTGQSDQFNTVKATDYFWALNANSSKTVKATDFRFDVHFSTDNPNNTP